MKLDNRNQVRIYMEGVLPCMAPLATPYVPFQQEDPPRYEPRKALIRGTLYPGLDLPFMGMVTQREKNPTPKNSLQTLAFAIQELALYLDTHRDDAKALEVYRAYQQIYHDAMMRFNDQQMPINHGMPNNNENYDWLNDPWPWEYQCPEEM